MSIYTGLIAQNVATKDARRIAIYNSQGNRVGQIPLGNLALPTNRGAKSYTFGALSDVHITYSTAADDFKRALTYLNDDIDVAFTCICGDLTYDGSETQLAQYKAIVESHSPDTPVYAIAGNHEATNEPTTTARIQPYTGHPLYYSFTYGDDVYIMLGEYRWSAEYLFEEGELQWLYETLEANRNKRCFVFFHVFPWGICGNANGLYPHNTFTGTPATIFQSLLRHYKNTFWFHGHSHLKYSLQEADETANYSEAPGYKSVHISSLAVPRDVNTAGTGYTDVYAASEGYVVDVYPNGIHLRGRDFVKEEFIPLGSLWIWTTLQEIPAGTYTDSTGTITT